ncbi:MAG: hypothetical protein ACRYG8_06770 [Janthinobacterium lividum]
MTAHTRLRPATSEARSVAALGSSLALVVLGLVHSAVVCLGRDPDADMATSSLLYEAVRRHGFSAISQWHYTQDNWLFSVILPELPLQLMFGDHPWLPAAIGWMFFVGSCAIVGLLAWRSIGTVCALFLSGTLLFASPISLTGAGFLAHPASHDVTTFWSLLALLPVLACLRGGSPGLLLASAAALLVATISDPWGRAGFLAPLGLMAACGIVLARGRIRRMSVWVGVSTIPSWLAGSHAFGLLPALTALHFDRGSLGDIPWHLLLALHGLGVLFSVIPVSVGDQRVWPGAATLFFLAFLLVLGVTGCRRLQGRLEAPEGLLALLCLFSTGATLTAFGLSAMPTDFSLTRLVLNSYFTLPLFLAVTLLSARWWLSSAALGIVGLLFVVAGLSVPWTPIREASVSVPGWQDRLTAFLQAHDLHYGYGGYWGSDANSSSLRTAGAVTIRPVSALGGMLPIQPTQSQTFDSWYLPSDAGSDPTHFFVAIPDPDLCPNRAACRALAIRSFGLPDRTLSWEGYDILVWSHPILFQDPGSDVLSALPPFGGAVTSGPGLQPYLWTGWTLPTVEGSWMGGARAVLMLPPVTVAGEELRTCLTLRAASGLEGGPTQTLVVHVNETTMVKWEVPPGLLSRHCIARQGMTPQVVTIEHGSEDNGKSANILLNSIESTSKNMQN